jgi:hypothetical protein
MFRKGQSGNPAGKKPGTKDKKWAHIQTFWNMLMETWDDLEPTDRAKYAFEGFKLHFDRAIANLPKDQQDSLKNAIAAQNLLDAVRRPTPEPTKVSS